MTHYCIIELKKQQYSKEKSRTLSNCFKKSFFDGGSDGF